MPIPTIQPHDVLVKVHAVSLNSRDIQIANVNCSQSFFNLEEPPTYVLLSNKIQGTYKWGASTPITPCSDCAGTIVSIGSNVSSLKPDDHVAATFHHGWISGVYPADPSQLSQSGAHEDGVLRQYAVFHKDDLVRLPPSLNLEEASCLPCAGVTAWSALFNGRRSVKPGDAVLVQGSGNVSLFAIQFAKAAGAFVVATTSELGGEREEKLRELGVNHVVSYLDPDWGAQVKSSTPGGRGVDFVVETAGEGEQDREAVAVGAQIAVVGGKGASGGNEFDVRSTVAEVRKILVGSKEDFEDMVKAVEVCGIRPVVDERIFGYQDVKETYEYATMGKPWGKVVIRVDGAS